MKILLVTPEYPPYHIGGGGIVVQSIAQTLLRKRHNVTVVSGNYLANSFFDKVTIARDGKIKVFWVPLMPTPRVPLNLKTVMPPSVLSVFCLIRILFTSNFDIIHLHGFGHLFIDLFALLCRIGGKCYILTLHGFPRSPLKAGCITRFLYRFYVLTLGRATLLKADKVTAVSSAVKEEAIAYGIDENRIVVIPNGINLTNYKIVKNSIEFRKRYGIGSDKRLVVSIGILHERKGFQYLIKALPLIKKQYENIKLVIIGRDGGYAEKLIKLAKRLKVEDKVIFTGFLNFKTKLMAMSEADVFVIPSLVEPFGLTALEAMAMRKLIVATEVNGLEEILKNNESAIMVRPYNSQELAKAIIKVLSGLDFRKKISKKAKDLKYFDWSSIVGRYLRIYASYSGKHSAPEV